MRLVEAKCFQRLMNLVLCLGVGLAFQVLNTPVSCCAQETEMQLEELQAKWKELDQKLIEKEAELKKGEGDPVEMAKEYTLMVDEANDLISKIESTAKAKLLTSPSDAGVIRTLMGIMLNDAENGRDGKVFMMGDLLIQQGINAEYFQLAAKTERLSINAREMFDELLIRQEEALAGDLPRVKFVTTKGEILMELYENEAPWTVGNFVNLVEKGTYTDMLFHRIVEGFMAQGGGFKMEDGKEVGGKGPGYEIKCECAEPDARPHYTGCLSMAHRGKDTGGSQFFITFSQTDFLDGRHTCFGRVTQGHDVLEALVRTHVSAEKSPLGREEPIPGVTKDKIISATVVRKRDHIYRPNRVGHNDVEDVAKEEAAIVAAKKKAAEEAIAKAKAEKLAAEKAAAEKAAAEKMAAEKLAAEKAAAKKAEMEPAAKAKAKAEAKAKADKEAAEAKAKKEADKKEADKKDADDKKEDKKEDDK